MIQRYGFQPVKNTSARVVSDHLVLLIKYGRYCLCGGRPFPSPYNGFRTIKTNFLSSTPQESMVGITSVHALGRLNLIQTKRRV